MGRRPWTFAQRVGAGLVLSLLAALVIVASALLSLHSVRASNQARTLALSTDLLEVERLRRAFSEKVSSGRAYALSGDVLFAQDMELARQRFLSSLDRLQRRLQEPPGPELLAAAARAEREHEDAFRALASADTAGADRQRLERIFEDQVGGSRARAMEALRRLAEHAEHRLAEGVRRAEAADRWALWLILLAGLLGLVGVAVLAWVLVRKLRPLQREAAASEERFRLLVEGVRDYALVLLDAQGRVTSWNPGAERISGWKAEEVVGRPARIFFPREAVEEGVPQELRRRADAEGRLHTEHWEVRKDGSRFRAEVVVTALRGEDGTLEGYVAVTRDVTERYRTQRTQRVFVEAGRLFVQPLEPDVMVEELARLMVPELADGCILFLLTPSGELRPRVVLHVSPSKQALLWELLRRNPPEHEPADVIMAALRTGRARRAPVLTREMLARGARDAEHLRMMEALEFRSYLAVPLRAGEGSRGVLALFSSQPDCFYTADDQVMVEELVGRAALALDNARLLREAQQALELIGVASHDLGNPLQTLQLHLQRLKRHAPGSEPDKLREGLEAALRQAQKLGQMLHNLLDFSRLSSGQMALDLAGVDLGELVQEVAARHTEQAAEAGCALEVEARLGLLGRWDRLRLERVVTNLVSNALKFGKGRPVELRVEREDGLARLVVRDHGEGIPLEAQEKIFDRFERQPSGGKHAGFGLGLYIVRQLVEAHGGTIRVESQPGEGAAFIVELPLTAPAQAEAEGSPAAPH